MEGMETPANSSQLPSFIYKLCDLTSGLPMQELELPRAERSALGGHLRPDGPGLVLEVARYLNGTVPEKGAALGEEQERAFLWQALALRFNYLGRLAADMFLRTQSGAIRTALSVTMPQPGTTMDPERLAGLWPALLMIGAYQQSMNCRQAQRRADKEPGKVREVVAAPAKARPGCAPNGTRRT